MILYEKKNKKNKNKVIVRLCIVLLYVLAFGGIITFQAGKEVIGQLLIGIMFLLGGGLGLYTKSITFYITRNHIYSNTSRNNYYGDKDLMYFLGPFINGLCILLGLGIIANI